MTATHKLRAFTLPATTFLAIAFLVIVVVLGATSARWHSVRRAVCPRRRTRPVTRRPWLTGRVCSRHTYYDGLRARTAHIPLRTRRLHHRYAYDSGWYPGRFVGRVNRAIWGYPTTTLRLRADLYRGLRANVHGRVCDHRVLCGAGVQHLCGELRATRLQRVLGRLRSRPLQHVQRVARVTLRPAARVELATPARPPLPLARIARPVPSHRPLTRKLSHRPR